MSIQPNDLELLKLNLQEQEPDIFTEEDLISLLDTHKNVWLASYFGCHIKATINANIELPGGLKISGNSAYWTQLAEVYYTNYLNTKSESDSDSSTHLINSAGYKNSMERADEFPPIRRW